MKVTYRAILFILCTLLWYSSQTCLAQSKVKKKAEAWYNEGVRLENAGMQDAAFYCYTKAIKKQKSYALPWMAKANMLYSNDSLTSAYEVLINGRKHIDKSNFKIDYGLALYSFLLGDYVAAQRHMESLLEYKPRFSSVFNYEVSILAKSIVLADSLVRNPLNYALNILSENVNSEYDEYFPSLTVDGEKLFFTRLDPRHNTSKQRWNEDLYSCIQLEGEWSPAQPLPSSVNSKMNEGANTISSDGRELFYAAMYHQRGDMNLYSSSYSNNQWTSPTPISQEVNSPSWDSQPCLSADGSMLFFTSSRPGGLGNSDIYVARRDSNNTFSQIEQLPYPINTPGNDQRPHFHPDGKTLYYSTNGLPGMGGSDLYKTELNDDGTWSTPINLGFPINSFKDERGIFVSGDGRLAYISTDRPGGMGGMDIYQFELPQSIAPRTTAYLKGTVLDSLSGQPIAATIEIYDLTRAKTYRTLNVDAMSGSFLIAIPGSFNYSFHITSSGKIPISRTLTSDTIFRSGELLNEEFLLSSPSIGNQFRLNNVFFETNSAVLEEISQQELQLVANWMATVEDEVIFELQGHTDNRGSEDWNLTLSQQRADAVRNYLVSIGIPADRLIARGFGMTRPIDTNETEEGRANNRRTEVHFR